MNNLDLLKKERTVYGYDIVKVIYVAFKMAEDHGKLGDAFDIAETTLMALMDDDLYKPLHEKAQKEHEIAMKATETLDKIIKTVKEIFDE